MNKYKNTPLPPPIYMQSKICLHTEYFYFNTGYCALNKTIIMQS